MRRVILAISFLLFCSAAISQIRISGRVYDITQKQTLEAVSVMTSSGGGTITDKNGHYTILVNEKDSIWFSYLGKATPKVPVSSIQNTQNFETALHVNIEDLKKVYVMPRDYKRDSVQNREEYAKAFNFRKPNLESLTSVSPNGGVGLDINEFIRMFQFRRNKRMLNFQQRLLKEETEKYIDHRFSRPLIVRITGLRGAELDTFIRWYRPEVEFIETATDYELQSYIKRCYISYQRYQRLRGPVMKKPDEE